VVLTPASGVVAAKVLESVDYQVKFPWIDKHFIEVGSAALKDEPVLLQAAGAEASASERALASGVESREIYPLPVFEAGDARVIVQNELIVRFKPDQTSDEAESLPKRTHCPPSAMPSRKPWSWART
jgi:hypothetical protein